jgi:CubicO group peptidase (beta-lactamase class C family)
MSLSAIDAALTEADRTASVPGFVAAAYLGDGTDYLAAFGRRSVGAPDPMTTDTVFWIASLTKLVTSVAALQLIEGGLLTLDTPVASILPEFADLPILDGFDAAGAPMLRPAPDRPTVRHLLTHTAGLGYTFADADLARYAEHAGVGPDQAYRLPRRFEAGAHWLYGVNTDWLGQLIAAVAGESLERLLARRIFGPLGMVDTSFAPTADQARRQAAVHARLPDGGLLPIDFALPPPPHFMMGGGGLYSTASDFMALLRGILDGAVLGPAATASLFTNAVGDLECGVLHSSNPAMSRDFEPLAGQPKQWSLGLLINPGPGADGRSASSGAWAGLANCYYWLDPTRRVAGLALSQILPFADPDVLGLFSSFERAVYA